MGICKEFSATAGE